MRAGRRRRRRRNRGNGAKTEIRQQMTEIVRSDDDGQKRFQSWLEWLDVGVVRWGGGGECRMLEESEGQGSRLRGERQGGRQRKRGSQVRVSDGDRPQRTQDIFLNTWMWTRATLLLRPR